ncbi:Hypothetical predicted protein [Olea europaea subsp. europaea]|uniref:Uncharacterized protein n=1 Tax=Olea europaea subsp. europaea TaxID=158383 RepID=A0A8S0R164_OLEEU|nr:Hypothetical predicted protein [Olea europaea subsp. europaea]
MCILLIRFLEENMEGHFGIQNCHHVVRSSARNKFFSLNEEITSVETADAESSKRTKLHCLQFNVEWRHDTFFMIEGFNREKHYDKELGVSEPRQYDDNIFSKPYVLPEPNICDHCGSEKFHKESRGFCCLNGQVMLKTNDVPIEL